MDGVPNSNSERYFFRRDLARLNNNVETLVTQVTELKVELATLKAKSSLWGGGAGGAVGVVIGFMSWLVQMQFRP